MKTMDRATVERTAQNLVAQVQRIADAMKQRDHEASERFQDFYRAIQEEHAQRALAMKATEDALVAGRDCLTVAAGVLAEIRSEHAALTIEIAAFTEQATQVAALIRSFADAVRALSGRPELARSGESSPTVGDEDLQQPRSEP